MIGAIVLAMRRLVPVLALAIVPVPALAELRLKHGWLNAHVFSPSAHRGHEQGFVSLTG